MKPFIRHAALLLPLLLTGCVHKNHAKDQPVLAPALEDTPPPPPSNTPMNLPPPVVTIPSTTPKVTPPPAPKPPPTPAPAKKQRKPSAGKPAQAATAAPANPAPQQQAATAPPEVSAVGNLSSGDGSDTRLGAQQTIDDVQRRLNGIARKLNDQEQKTYVQIREYLKQARAALGSGDMDGAQTLATKARVLLGELSQ